MNLKEFLKLTWTKIAIVFIIFSIVLFSFWIYFYTNYVVSSSVYLSNLGVCGYRYGRCVESVEGYNKLNASKIREDFDFYRDYSSTRIEWILSSRYSIYPYYISVFVPFGRNKLFVGMIEDVSYPDVRFAFQEPIIQLILLFVYWYLISCIIVWVYDKVKRGAKKR